ncbi:MAG: hypothetical protein QM775_01815 [Pirellulales bacterium]
MLTSDWQAYHYPKNFDGPLWRYIGGYFTPLVLYWVAKQAVWNERTARLVQTSFVVFGAYLAFTAVCEIAQLWTLVWPKYIADPKIGLHFGRARGPMVHGVTFGHYMSVCLLAGYIWACSRGKTSRLTMALLLPLFAAGVYLSYTAQRVDRRSGRPLHGARAHARRTLAQHGPRRNRRRRARRRRDANG